MKHKRYRLTVESLDPRRMLDAGSLWITEVMYNPSLTDQQVVDGIRDRDLEFVEFLNTGDQPASIVGATIEEAISLTFEPATLAPGEYGVVVANPAAFVSRYGNGPRIIGQWLDSTLGNGGDRLVFKDAVGRVVQDLTYDDGWYTETDGSGPSLAAVDPFDRTADPNSSTSWQPSARFGGSPGFADGVDDPRPHDLSATPLTSRHVALAWSPPARTDANMSGFRVYRNGDLLQTVSNMEFTDANAYPGGTFVYQVAISYSDGSEYLGDPITATIDAVGGDLRFASGVSTGIVTQPGLLELSGLVASRRNENVLWTHNDGPQTAVHAINAAGVYLGAYHLSGLVADDWEDIAIGPGPEVGRDYLYIGDIGTKRNITHIYRFAEPVLSADAAPGSHTISSFETITLRYPAAEEFNAESLLVDPISGDLFVLPKKGNNTPIYRAAASQLVANSTVVLENIGELSFPDIAGGDISATGRDIIIRNEDIAQRFVRQPGQTIADALLMGISALAPVIGTPLEPNGEAVTFDGRGENYFTISEGVNPALYFFARISPSRAGDANRDGQLTVADIDQVMSAGQFDVDAQVTWEEGDWNGDGLFDMEDIAAVIATASFDANSDGRLDSVDADEIVMSIVSAAVSESFDFTRDGTVDRADLGLWMRLAGFRNLTSHQSYALGDANLDGSVDVTDLGAWMANRFRSDLPKWSSGDFNADGWIDGSDFNVWNDNRFHTTGAVRNTTPGQGVARPPRAALSSHHELVDRVFSRRLECALTCIVDSTDERVPYRRIRRTINSGRVPVDVAIGTADTISIRDSAHFALFTNLVDEFKR